MRQKTVFLTGLGLTILLATLGLVMMSGSGALAQGDPTPTLAPLAEPVLGDFDPASIADIDLADYPVVPEISDQAKLLYQAAIDQGSNPHTFVKIGDCMTDNEFFMIPLGEEGYDLGEYSDLEPVIEQFIDGDLNSFSRKSQAAAGGFNSASILDSMWANPEFCEAGENPLTCEFRHMEPSVALIMFGTNDVYYLDEKQFDFFLRSIIVETIRHGALPVLSTFPNRPEFPEKAVLFNQIVVKAALDYDIPLINLWLALEDLPNQGVDPEDTTHLTEPEEGNAATFTETNLETGFVVRNLVTLQALDAVLKAVSAEE